jgi:hypothetical protein
MIYPGSKSGKGIMTKTSQDISPESSVGYGPPSFRGGFYCSRPIHRRFLKKPDKSGNYRERENINCIFQVRLFRLVFFSVLGILLLTLGACSGHKGKAQILAPKSELELRKLLRIPAAAEKVVIFSQSVHLDLDWQKTFSEYYNASVESVFTDSFDLIKGDPRYFYSIGE